MLPRTLYLFRANKKISILQFLIEQQEVKPEYLLEVVGSQDVVFELVNGEGEISDQLAEVLGNFFKVAFSLFRE